MIIRCKEGGALNKASNWPDCLKHLAPSTKNWTRVKTNYNNKKDTVVTNKIALNKSHEKYYCRTPKKEINASGLSHHYHTSFVVICRY